MIGTCRSMCPDSEISLRERENLLHYFEVAENHTSRCPRANRGKCVKEYRRPTVGKQEVNPGEVRPPEVLVQTVNYLIQRITTQNCRWSEIYDFVFDRLRAVRQDLVVQDVHGAETVYILEKAVRFHIYSDYRLCREHIAVFDEKINSQHTQECLKRLINLYNENYDISWQNRVEIETVYLLFNLGDNHAIDHYYTLDYRLRHSHELMRAYTISCAFIHNNWVKLFREFRKLKSPVYLCAVHRHLPYIQRNALFTMNAGYSSKNLKFPLEKIKQLLLLNTDTEAQTLVQQFGITVEGTSAKFLKTDFKGDEKIERVHSDYINDRLQQWNVADLIHGGVGVEGDTDLSQSFAEKCQT
ncbi:SAC3 domain-containing protein 1-like [Ruditapes philippinarum]|uniref:SAC3 domain-containing protein 1-like n=1 Tax=Ruditapes philippinarum TaxID=129788 RepID=UPI00295C3579|nr:SAC3 domain-containing protein 1-like [Ruditapes philippinarum]